MDKNISRVYLLNVPLENDYKNTLYFTSKEDQQSYFRSKVIRDYSYDDFSYQRQDGVLSVPMMYDDALQVNYVMYQNTAYSNRWFYAFVTDIEYKNEDCTNLTLETDVMQTWLFDYIMKPSFVEREHVSNDTIGKHTQPEQLETGEYVDQFDFNDRLDFVVAPYSSQVVVAVSELSWNPAVPEGIKQYNGIYNGLYYLMFPNGKHADAFINYQNVRQGADSVYAVFIAPPKLLVDDEGVAPEYIEYKYQKQSGDKYDNFTYAFVPYTYFAVEMSAPQLKIYNYLDDGYVPRNKKLLTYPYRCLVMSNSAGSNAIYRYELFNTKTSEGSYAKFKMEGVISPGCSIKLSPVDYGITGLASSTYVNYAEGLDAGKLPTCGWINDPFLNYMTQNSANIPIDLTKSAVDITAGAGMLAAGAKTGGGSIVSGLFDIASTIGQVYQQWTIPPTAKGGVNQGDFNYSNQVSFIPYRKSIKREYAEIIDSYFDMFGYKVNKVKLPNKAHRSRWWFTKTIDVNIDGALPQKDLQKIKDCYNRGITFWRNADEIQNYSLSNSINITSGAVTD